VVIYLYFHINALYVRFLYNFGFRIEKAKKFVKAISRPTRSDLAPIRVKEPVRFEQVETIFPRFVCYTMLSCACTTWVKKDTLRMFITLRNINQFSKGFHW